MTDDVRLAEIARLCATDVGRNVEALFKAVRADFPNAVRSIAAALTPHVAIVTGFFIPTSEPPAPETDGLTGSVHLAAGLLKAGISAHLITDHSCEAALRAAARSIEITIPITTCGTSRDDVMTLGRELTRMSPSVTHLVSIERLGPSASGRLLGQFGFDFTPHMAPFHELFAPANRPPGCVTIGAGDGGNEIGMGKLPRELVARHVENGELVQCVTPTDNLIVCGVSNWAGPAILCGLAAVRPELADRLLTFLNAPADRQMLSDCVFEGPAVDGSPETIQMSIDGLPWDYHWTIMSTMKSAATA